MIIETLSLYLHITIKNNAMKKQEMIDLIKAEERKLYDDLQQCIDILGVHDPITESATTRWSTIHNLLKTLGL